MKTNHYDLMAVALLAILYLNSLIQDQEIEAAVWGVGLVLYIRMAMVKE